MLRDYIVQNWALILILPAFAISLKTTIFLDRQSVRRLYILIAGIFLLSVVVFLEFALGDLGGYITERTVLMAVRYSATPIIVAMILYTLVKKIRWFIFPIAFLAFAFASCVFLPFVFGRNFSTMFCITIAIALFIYFEFLILQGTKKDPLTGVLNRQAYFADTEVNPDRITGLVTVDMNGLKEINDRQGHAAGDEALTTLALCLLQAGKQGQSVYRIGGDEFVIVCRSASREDVLSLADRVRKNVAEAACSCALGYCYSEERNGDIEGMLRESDRMMYAEKARYYQTSGKDRRRRSQDRAAER